MIENVDVLVERNGGVWGMRPLTTAGREWMEANVEVAPYHARPPSIGGFWADWRMAQEIWTGMEADGLTVTFEA